MTRLSKWVAEAHRRHVFRVAGVYIVGSWVALQVADLAFESFDIPVAAMRLVWFALIACFPLALFWGWRYDITIKGIVRTAPSANTKPHASGLGKPDVLIISTLVAIVLFVVSGMVFEIQRLPQSTENRYTLNRNVLSTIAVLPLANLSGDDGQNYLSAGLHDALITSLAKIASFRVISRTSTLRVSRNLTIPEIAKRLGVDKIIEGSVTREGDNVRIIVQLIDAKTDEHLWTENYVRKFDGLLSLQNEMATSIASAVQVRLTPTEMRRLESRGDINPDTYDAYLRGMYKIRRETGKGMRDGMQILTDAVENDPTSALAWAGLAHAYSELGHSAFPEEGAYPRAKAAADRALELDPGLAEAHLAVAMYRIYYEWDFAGGEEALARAIAINPSLVSAHYHLAWLMELLGRKEDAIRIGELTKTLDPLSPFYSGWLAEQYRDARMYDKAIDEAQATLKLRKNYPLGLVVLGQTYLELGRIDEALEQHEKLRSNYYWSFTLATTLGSAGRIDEAIELSRKYEKNKLAALVMVMIYSSVGDHDTAYRYLLKCRDLKIPWYPWLLKWFPQTRGMQQDPRVLALAAEIGL
jgi:TolB-like protein/tetratricopeptide (TPR) repeat protein